MKTIVITVQDEVCARTNRDPEATALIEAARNFGTVECLATPLTAEDLAILANIRKRVATETEVFKKEIAAKDAQIAAARREIDQRKAALKEMFGL